MYYLMLLLALLFVLGVIAYMLNRNDILSTWIIALSMFGISVFVCMLNISKWEITIYPFTVVVIISAMIFLGIGEVMGRGIYRGWNPSIKNSLNHRYYNSIKISYLVTFFCCVLMLGVTALYFRYIYHLSLVVGNMSGYSEMFKYARYAVINVKYEVSMPSYLSHLLLMSKCVSYIYIASVLYNRVLCNKTNMSFLFPIIIYVVQISISTERMDFIRLITYTLMLIFIFWKKKNSWSSKLDFKILLLGVGGILIFLLMFRLLGFLTMKSDSRDLWDDLSTYMGSSIAALNQYLSNDRVENSFFGKETLFNFYKVLRGLRLTSIPDYNIPLEFFYYSSYRTNIYTALRRVIQDYGYLGLYIVMMIEGFFYSFWLEKIKSSAVSVYSVILFSSLFYAIVEIAIEERFISNLTSLATIYQCIYLGIFYIILIKIKNKSVRL